MTARIRVLPQPPVEDNAARAIANAKQVLRRHDVVGVAMVAVFRDGSTGTVHSANASTWGRHLHSAAVYLTHRIERDFYQ